MTRITRTTGAHIRELEAHAATLNRALAYLAQATENARRDRNLALMQWIDKEATSLTKELDRVRAERRAIQQELADEDVADRLLQALYKQT